MKEAALSPKLVTEGMIKVFDAAKKGTHGGKLWEWDGSELGFDAKDE